jgi:uncharacterized protein (DUF952 family)
MVLLPEGYIHKATTDNFNQTAKAVIYYSKVEELYLVHVEADGIIQSLGTLTAQHLQLVVDAAEDALHDAKV